MPKKPRKTSLGEEAPESFFPAHAGDPDFEAGNTALFRALDERAWDAKRAAGMDNSRQENPLFKFVSTNWQQFRRDNSQAIRSLGRLTNMDRRQGYDAAHRLAEKFIQEYPVKARAKGGPVKKGEDYLVGEEGPEVFRPAQDGEIVPNPKSRLDELQSKIDELNLKLTDLESQPLPEPEVKRRLPTRIFAGIGDALQSYASIAQGGPGVQSNIERFLESQMTERREKRAELRRQREAQMRGTERQLGQVESGLQFERETQRRAAEAAEDFANRQTLTKMEIDARAEQGRLDRDSAAAAAKADMELRLKQFGHLQGEDRRKAEAELDAKNESAMADLYQLYSGAGREQVLDPQTQQMVPADLAYRIRNGLTWGQFLAEVDALLAANGATPNGRHQAKEVAQQLWRASGGSLPGDAQAPVSAGGDKPEGGTLQNLYSRFGSFPTPGGIPIPAALVEQLLPQLLQRLSPLLQRGAPQPDATAAPNTGFNPPRTRP